MKRFLAVPILALLILASMPLHVQSEGNTPPAQPACNADRVNWTMGLVYCDGGATEGYTLFSPLPGNTTYLIDHNGRFVHEWTSPGEHRPGLSAYLLEDGSLLRTANIAQTSVGNFSGGGTAGKVERISWNGTLEWSWTYDSTEFISHHDIEPMPNGNVLMIAWEDKTEEEATQAGRNPALASDSPNGENNVWPDHIIEVQPVGTNDATIVWRWHAWDHLVQDYDPTKDNYGVVEDHPELLNINYVSSTGNQAGRADWMHCNGIDYNALLDQIAISCRGMDEIYILDHSTTTEEAAGHTGGNAGKGGDFLYRWGNPQVYKKGLSSNQQLFGQHDVQWIPQGHPNEGQLMVFNNGNGRSVEFSSVDIINPIITNGSYELQANGTYGPNQPAWTWDLGTEMYASAISGAHALSNGHVLVTYGTSGTLYEVDGNGDVVWTYINPVGNSGPFNQSESIPQGNRAGTTANQVFKATHYQANYAGLTQQDLTPGDYLEVWIDQCPEQEAWQWDQDGDGCIDDSDGDGVLDPNDVCSEGDDFLDEDNDGIADPCDEFVDSDSDGIADVEDRCPGHDDNVDLDGDGTVDGCDELIDSDADGVGDNEDRCEGYDDTEDSDNDGVPNGCDASPFPAEEEVEEEGLQDVDEQNNGSLPSTNDSKEDQVPTESNAEAWTASELSRWFLVVLGLWGFVYVALRYRSQLNTGQQQNLLTLESAEEEEKTYETTPPLEAALSHSAPPLPQEGLPEGWTLEQWQHEGHQWIENYGHQEQP
ncbi:MAG: aryl-sulfate sulfotransferase [Poseidonia sp.]